MALLIKHSNLRTNDTNYLLISVFESFKTFLNTALNKIIGNNKCSIYQKKIIVIHQWHHLMAELCKQKIPKFPSFFSFYPIFLWLYVTAVVPLHFRHLIFFFIRIAIQLNNFNCELSEFLSIPQKNNFNANCKIFHSRLSMQRFFSTLFDWNVSNERYDWRRKKKFTVSHASPIAIIRIKINIQQVVEYFECV